MYAREVEKHLLYLIGTLIPDCLESGSYGHAEDHAMSAIMLAKAWGFPLLETRALDLKLKACDEVPA